MGYLFYRTDTYPGSGYLVELDRKNNPGVTKVTGTLKLDMKLNLPDRLVPVLKIFEEYGLILFQESLMKATQEYASKKKKSAA